MRSCYTSRYTCGQREQKPLTVGRLSEERIPLSLGCGELT